MSITLLVSKLLERNKISLSWTLSNVELFGGALPNASRFRVYRAMSRDGEFEQISIEVVRNEQLQRVGADNKDELSNRYISKILFVGDDEEKKDYESTDYELIYENAKYYIHWLDNIPDFNSTYYVTYNKEQELGITTFTDEEATERMGLDWYYKVGLVDITGEEGHISSVVKAELVPDSLWMQLLQDERIRRIYQSLILSGEEIRYFKRKQAGTLCSCVSGMTSLEVEANCTECYGTGFVGGFEEISQRVIDRGTYVVPKMFLSEIGRVLEYQRWAKVELESPNIFTTQVPPFDSNDLLIRKDNDRFLVKEPYLSHRAGKIHRLDATLDHVPHLHIFYSVGV